MAAAAAALLLVTEAAAAALVLAGGGRPGARRVAFGEGQAEAVAVPRTARKAGPASGPRRREKLRFGRHGPCSRRFSSPAGVAGGGGGVAGGGNDFQWCFSQVKGAIDEDVAEGKMRRRE